MADPKLWLRSDGRYTEVHTPCTTRAKELFDIYNGLKLKSLSLDERLSVLLNTKWTVKEFDTELTREIVDLIDREADMLNRGRSESSLEGYPLFCESYYFRSQIKALQFVLAIYRDPQLQPRSCQVLENPYRIALDHEFLQMMNLCNNQQQNLSKNKLFDFKIKTCIQIKRTSNGAYLCWSR